MRDLTMKMKVVKLNRTHKMFKERGHTYGFRFDGYEKDIINIEKICQELYGTYWYEVNGPWSSHFGHAIRGGPKPYWVTVRDEHYVTLILLRLNHVA
jgi:hypothetical protein